MDWHLPLEEKLQEIANPCVFRTFLISKCVQAWNDLKEVSLERI